jgi:hypothetical protein
VRKKTEKEIENLQLQWSIYGPERLQPVIDPDGSSPVTGTAIRTLAIGPKTPKLLQALDIELPSNAGAGHRAPK